LKFNGALCEAMGFLWPVEERELHFFAACARSLGARRGKRWHARCSDCQRASAVPGQVIAPPTKPMFPCCSAVRMTHYTPEQSRDACAALAQPRTDSRDRTTKKYTTRDNIMVKSSFLTAANLTFSWRAICAVLATLLFFVNCSS
jgi:hypothetical protein